LINVINFIISVNFINVCRYQEILKKRWAWWYMSLIPVLGRERQEDLEFDTSFGCIGNRVSK
jgi:hypothetical protein